MITNINFYYGKGSLKHLSIRNTWTVPERCLSHIPVFCSPHPLYLIRVPVFWEGSVRDLKSLDLPAPLSDFFCNIPSCHCCFWGGIPSKAPSLWWNKRRLQRPLYCRTLLWGFLFCIIAVVPTLVHPWICLPPSLHTGARVPCWQPETGCWGWGEGQERAVYCCWGSFHDTVPLLVGNIWVCVELTLLWLGSLDGIQTISQAYLLSLVCLFFWSGCMNKSHAGWEWHLACCRALNKALHLTQQLPGLKGVLVQGALWDRSGLSYDA